ncbi:hypothetical protein D3C78_1861420 [compost metagenome]
MRCDHQLAAKCKQVVLPIGVVAAQPSFDDIPYCTQKLDNKNFQQGHSCSRELGAVGLNVAEALKTAEHLD